MKCYPGAAYILYVCLVLRLNLRVWNCCCGEKLVKQMFKNWKEKNRWGQYRFLSINTLEDKYIFTAIFSHCFLLFSRLIMFKSKCHWQGRAATMTTFTSWSCSKEGVGWGGSPYRILLTPLASVICAVSAYVSQEESQRVMFLVL